MILAVFSVQLIRVSSVTGMLGEIRSIYSASHPFDSIFVVRNVLPCRFPIPFVYTLDPKKLFTFDMSPWAWIESAGEAYRCRVCEALVA